MTWIKGVDNHLLGKVNGALKTFDIESGQICGGIEIGTDQDPVLAVAAVQPVSVVQIKYCLSLAILHCDIHCRLTS